MPALRADGAPLHKDKEVVPKALGDLTNTDSDLRRALKLASTHDRRGNTDYLVRGSVDCPWLHGRLQSSMELGRVGDKSRHSLDKHAPPAPPIARVAVSFEGEDSADCGRVQLGAVHGAKHHVAVQECEVDWQQCWKRRDRETNPSDRHAG